MSEKTQLLSPYQAAQKVNVILEAASLPLIPSQMMYNYTSAKVRAGKTPLIPVVEKDGRTYITSEALEAWVTKYVAKKLAPKPVEVPETAKA